jgi:hypothetical protein
MIFAVTLRKFKNISKDSNGIEDKSEMNTAQWL